MLFGVISSFYFLYNSQNKYHRTISVASIFAFNIIIVLSASRKIFVGELFFILISFWMIMRRRTNINVKSLIATVFGLSAIFVSVYFIYNDTFLGERLNIAFEGEQQAVYLDERLTGRGIYYVEAIEMFGRNPIRGIGLNNFRNHFFLNEDPSHSEYISIIVETGLIGAILYFGAYFLVLRRLRWLKRRAVDEEIRNKAVFFIVAIITILLIGIGKWNYDSYATYIFVATAGNFAWLNRNRMLKNN